MISQRGRKVVGSASRATLERLEDRQMLTTFVGGETFEFDQWNEATGTTQRIRAEFVGNHLTAEVVGGYVNDTNTLSFMEIPGIITQSPIGRTGVTISGGPSGGVGIQDIGPDNTIGDTLAGGNVFAATNLLNFMGLASNQITGNSYAVNVMDITLMPGAQAQKHVQLVQINNTNGLATVLYDLENDPAMPHDPNSGQGAAPFNIPICTAQRVTAADYSNGELWFVMVDNTPAQVPIGQPVVPGVDVPRLYRVDPATGNLANVQGDFQTNAGANPAEIPSIAFRPGGGLTALTIRNNQTFLEDINPNNTNNIFGAVRVTMGGADVTTITGIAYVPYDPGYVYGITSDPAGSHVVKINPATGVVTILSDIPVGFQGLTYNPRLVDPFRNQLGALIGTNTITDHLAYLNTLPVKGQMIFNIGVTESDANSQIIISRVTVPNANDPLNLQGLMTPFQGNTNDNLTAGGRGVQVWDAQTGLPFSVSGDDGTGYVYIGQRNRVAVPGSDVRYMPITSGPLAQPYNSLGVPIGGQLDAGLNVSTNLETSLLQAWQGGAFTPDMSLWQNNVDDIVGMSVDAAGTVYVVNHVPAVGDSISTWDGTRDPNSGQMITSAPLPLLLNATQITDVAAMDWGDPDGSGDSLFIAYGGNHLGLVDPTNGAVTDLGSLGTGAVTAMAFNGQDLYVLDNTGELFVVNVDTILLPHIANLTDVGQLTDPNYPVIDITSMDFDGKGQLIGADTRNGRLVNIDPTSGAVAGLVNTPQGSLRATVGAISYDPLNKRFLAADNDTGALILPPGQGDDQLESASLYMLRGWTTASAAPQDMDKFMLAGTVTGQVHVTGSMNMFYSGWLLTGATDGQELLDPNIPGNFSVGGELRDLITRSSIGTLDDTLWDASHYTTGFDLNVGGRIGEVTTYHDYMGNLTVGNDATTLPAGTTQTEIENRDTAPNPDSLFASGLLCDQNAGGLYNNDTFNTAQNLGSINSTDPDLGNNSLQVEGYLYPWAPANDFLDYYSVALMAGQTITVQLLPTAPQSLHMINVGVFDPDGREVATDIMDQDTNQYWHAPFQVTIDRPGMWRFAVAMTNNGDFGGGQFTNAPYGDNFGGTLVQHDVPVRIARQWRGRFGVRRGSRCSARGSGRGRRCRGGHRRQHFRWPGQWHSDLRGAGQCRWVAGGQSALRHEPGVPHRSGVWADAGRGAELVWHCLSGRPACRDCVANLRHRTGRFPRHPGRPDRSLGSRGRPWPGLRHFQR